MAEDAAEQGAPLAREVGALTWRPAPWLAAATLVALVLVTFWPATQAGFVWHDEANVTQNIPLRDAAGLQALWLTPGTTTPYYPVVYTSFWLDYRLWGLDPFGYHVANILLHALASVLLWRVLLALTLPGAWLAAAVFAVHPLQVETVAWVTERKNLLSFVFAAASALVYLRRVARLDESEWPFDGRGYALSLALYLAALLSKLTSVTLGPAFLVIVWWKRGRLQGRDVLPILPMLALALPLGVWTRSLKMGVGETWALDWSPSLLEQLLQGSRALAFYLGKLAWPQGLSFVYPRWEIDAGEPVQYLPLLALVGLTALFFYLARARSERAPLTSLLLYSGLLAPVLGLFEVYYFRFSYVADHWQYAAGTAPVALAVGGAAGWLVGQREWLRRLGVALAIVWIAALATLSWQRAWYFESSLALFEDAVAHNPDSFFTRYSYGAALQQRARREEAMAQYRVALEIDPGGVPAWVEIGLLHSQRGERALAIEAWERAVALDPLRSRAHWNLGLAWLEEGETERGLGHLERSVEIVTPAPSEWESRRSGYAQLGQILLDRGLHARATTSFERSLELDPGYHAARLGLARSLVAAGRRRAALAQIDIVLSARSNHVQARRLRARLASP